MKKRGAFVEVLGVYLHKPSAAVVKAQSRTLGDDSPAGQAKARRELERAVMVEVLVHHPTKQFNFRFGQGGKGMNSFAWDPNVLSLDGRELIGKQIPVEMDTARVTFWIHAFAPQTALKTQYGSVALPPSCTMPPRLAKIVPYATID